jgi:dihydrofolate reductase
VPREIYTTMSPVTSQMSVSLDGFAAGPNQSPDDPIGVGGMRLHEWALATAGWREAHGQEGGERSADSEIAERMMEGIGAFIMGRRMFGGDWDESWRGWWGDDPPYHAPVFVLSHHEREPLPMEGGTTFTFVTGGIESALEQARAAAGDKDVSIAGGASTVAQYLRAGLLDELYLHVAPVLLGSGERLFDNAGDATFEPIEVVASPAVTHIRYRVVRG